MRVTRPQAGGRRRPPAASRQAWSPSLPRPCPGGAAGQHLELGRGLQTARPQVCAAHRAGDPEPGHSQAQPRAHAGGAAHQAPAVPTAPHGQATATEGASARRRPPSGARPVAGGSGASQPRPRAPLGLRQVIRPRGPVSSNLELSRYPAPVGNELIISIK